MKSGNGPANCNKGNQMAKGSSFERLVCKQLSMWWSAGTRDDIFWRSSNSGGRATVRGKSGKSTFGHCGDIAATDPIGQSLLNKVTFELKRGYSKCSCADLLDQLPNRKPTGFEEFVIQAQDAAQRAKTPFWVLVQRRDGKKATVFLPYLLYSLIKMDMNCHCTGPRYQMRVAVRKQWEVVVAMRLDDFLAWCRPEFFSGK
jgi:hypothetical protein